MLEKVLAYWGLKLGHLAGTCSLDGWNILFLHFESYSYPCISYRGALNGWGRRGILCEQVLASGKWPQFESALNIIFSHLRNGTKQFKFYYAFKSHTSESYNSWNFWFYYMLGTEMPTFHLRKLHHYEGWRRLPMPVSVVWRLRSKDVLLPLFFQMTEQDRI